MRHIAVWLMPSCAASWRALQCVAFFGVVCNVVTTTRSTCSSLMLRGAPERGASAKPSIPCSANLLRHLPTVRLLICSCFAIVRFETPDSAHARMMVARKDKPWAVQPRLLQLRSVPRSASDSVMGMACGLVMEASSIENYRITMRPYRISWKFPIRTTGAVSTLYAASCHMNPAGHESQES